MKKIIFFLLLLVFLMFGEYAQASDHSATTGDANSRISDGAFTAEPQPSGSE